MRNFLKLSLAGLVLSGIVGCDFNCKEPEEEFMGYVCDCRIFDGNVEFIEDDEIIGKKISFGKEIVYSFHDSYGNFFKYDDNGVLIDFVQSFQDGGDLFKVIENSEKMYEAFKKCEEKL